MEEKKIISAGYIKRETINFFYQLEIKKILKNYKFEYPIKIRYDKLCLSAIDKNKKELILSGQTKNQIIENFFKIGNVDEINLINEATIEYKYVYKF